MDSKTLDTVVSFLAKRDGIDKVVKLARYVGRLQAYYLLKRNAQSVWGKAFDQFETHCAIGRKAYRLGKFLGPLSELRAVNRRDKLLALFTLVSCVGEAVYLFLDQFVWLSKTGLLRKSVQERVLKPSATGELLGYLGGVALNLLKLVRVQEKRATLIAIAQARRRQMEANARANAGSGLDASASIKLPSMTSTVTNSTVPLTASGFARSSSTGALPQPLMLTDGTARANSCDAAAVPVQGSAAAAAAAQGGGVGTPAVSVLTTGTPAVTRTPSFTKPPAGGKDVDVDIAQAIDAMGDEMLTRSLAVLQCLADAAFPIADLRDKQGVLSDKGLLSCLGILSAVISIHKNWRACRK